MSTGTVIEWLFALERLGMKFGLESISGLLHALGNPHQAFDSVLVAGTNGKGSVTAILETALRRAGHRTARYTSPHLERVEERFVIDGEDITREGLERSAGRVREAVERLMHTGALAAPPTFFEAATAIAFDSFRAAGVTIAAVEVGLGGRLDSTNVLSPLVSVITTIDLDHQAQLGDTIEQIAAEKAGIIKPGTPVVIGRLPPAAEHVVLATADRLGARVVRAADAVPDLEGIVPALPGKHQRENASVALAVLATLVDRGVPVPEDAARFGVEHVRWPGRLEHLRRGTCDLLLDAAHNPAGARALADYLREIGWTDAVLVFGAMADKDAGGMLRELLPAVSAIVCTTAPTPRAASAEALATAARSMGGNVQVELDPEAALDRACARSGHVVVAGSMFLIGPLRGILR